MNTNIPPGLQGPAKEFSSGKHPAYDVNWMSFEKTKLFTNVFLWDKKSGKILLGFKKRGFGMGLFNGFGGKVEPGESPHEAAVRELREEAGVHADMSSCGTLLFYSEGYDYAHHIEIFSSDVFDGNPVETEEMRPEWFLLPSQYHSCSSIPELPPIPFDKMWPDDRLWMPLMLDGKRFIGRVDFKKLTDVANEAEMVKWWFGTVE